MKVVQWFKRELRIRKGFGTIVAGIIVFGFGVICALLQGGFGPIIGHFVGLAAKGLPVIGGLVMIGGAYALATLNDDLHERQALEAKGMASGK